MTRNTFRQIRTTVTFFTALTIFSPPALAQSDVGGTNIEPLPPTQTNQSNGITQAQANGLKPIYRRFGKLRVSVDAAGSNADSHQVYIVKPSADANLVQAFLFASSHNSVAFADGDITLDGQPVSWSDSVTNGIASNTTFFNSAAADVTSLVRSKVNSSSDLRVPIRVREGSKNTNIDGEILAAVFTVPSLEDSERRTIALLFGGLRTSGDSYEITLNQPIDKTNGAYARMGLGVAYGCQGNNCGGGPSAQYSTIDVNGQRLTTSAGGADDGSGNINGALITAGGRSDSAANPDDPYLNSTDMFYDDEYYNLLPFLENGDTEIVVNTQNPSDDDNVLFAWFELSGNADINKDSDGDGLLDHWERYGYDHDKDGIVDVPLHELGFDYLRKDVAIAYAWMREGPGEQGSHAPATRELTEVTNSFARARVTNPDGTNGITLHWKKLRAVPHDSNLSPVWTEFDELMDPLLTDAERKIYHRMLMAHGYSSSSSSGLSRGIPASDFIVSLGGWPINRYIVSGTIMHELGHNLGLRHGGTDNSTYKPNYLSVMSYLYQLDWLTRDGKPWLDYQRFPMNDIDENGLVERDGLNKDGSEEILESYGARWRLDSGPVMHKKRNAHENIDWDDNGTYTRAISAAEISADGIRSTITGAPNDWENLIYDGGSIGTSSAVLQTPATSPAVTEEITLEQYLEMRDSVIEVQ